MNSRSMLCWYMIHLQRAKRFRTLPVRRAQHGRVRKTWHKAALPATERNVVGHDNDSREYAYGWLRSTSHQHQKNALLEKQTKPESISDKIKKKTGLEELQHHARRNNTHKNKRKSTPVREPQHKGEKTRLRRTPHLREQANRLLVLPLGDRQLRAGSQRRRRGRRRSLLLGAPVLGLYCFRGQPQSTNQLGYTTRSSACTMPEDNSSMWIDQINITHPVFYTLPLGSSNTPLGTN